MDFTISVDDSLVPGIIAISSLEGKDPEEIVQNYAYAAVNKACQDLKVGPYYEGPVSPQFNADGTLYEAPARSRARNEDGTFTADDPSTPDVDEAWEPLP